MRALAASLADFVSGRLVFVPARLSCPTPQRQRQSAKKEEQQVEAERLWQRLMLAEG